MAMAVKKTQSIQGVLFDWDGTLLNPYEADSIEKLPGALERYHG